MTDAELESLIINKMLSHKDEMLKAYKDFLSTPDARTFRNAETRADKQMGLALDESMGQLAQASTQSTPEEIASQKKGIM